MPNITSAALRRFLSDRNMDRSREHEHELSYGAIPSVIYHDDEGKHGNFLPASYRAICARPEWRKRLEKSYAGSRWVPRAWERERRELDCANSSDALLMNVFCCPKVLLRPEICAMLGIEPGLTPEFGFRPRIPLATGRGDATEIDMKLGDLLVESKLTETGFQTAPHRLVLRYRDLSEVFHVDELPQTEEVFRGYQLIRGALAAYSTDSSFLLLCDGRRADLIECWFSVVRAIRSCELRCRLKLLTWQEIARVAPPNLRRFLHEKYGITYLTS